MRNIFFIVAVLTCFAFANKILEPLTTEVQVKQGKLLGIAEKVC